jgi:hypothetical protein
MGLRSPARSGSAQAPRRVSPQTEADWQGTLAVLIATAGTAQGVGPGDASMVRGRRPSARKSRLPWYAIAGSSVLTNDLSHTLHIEGESAAQLIAERGLEGLGDAVSLIRNRWKKGYARSAP